LRKPTPQERKFPCGALLWGVKNPLGENPLFVREGPPSEGRPLLGHDYLSPRRREGGFELTLGFGDHSRFFQGTGDIFPAYYIRPVFLIEINPRLKKGGGFPPEKKIIRGLLFRGGGKILTRVSTTQGGHKMCITTCLCPRV